MRVGDVIDGKYKLVQPLGESGIGIVYEAIHEDRSDQVVVKVLHSHAASIDKAIKTCLDESTTVGGLDSPYLVPVLDTGVYNASPYIVRPFLTGSDLGSILAENNGPLHPTRVIPLIRQACEGLETARVHGHHHWNLKPRNLLVTGDPEAGETVKLLDFGVARIRDALAAEAAESTVAGTTLGKPRYMPMEQIRGVEDRDHRVDIYALGVILYELLTGFRPYEAESYTRLLLLIATTDPAPVQKKRPAIGDGLARVIHKALEREPMDRFKSFEELSGALESVTNDILVEEPHVVEVVAKLTRREASKTLPDIPLSEHVKRAAKLYEEREKSKPVVGKEPSRDRRWLYVGIAVACSVVLAVVIVGVTYLVRSSNHDGIPGATSVPSVQADAASGESWAERCTFHVLSKRYDEAQVICSQGIDETEDFDEKASMIYNLGRIAAARGDRETARRQFEKALMLDPDNPAFLRRLEELGP